MNWHKLVGDEKREEKPVRTLRFFFPGFFRNLLFLDLEVQFWGIFPSKRMYKSSDLAGVSRVAGGQYRLGSLILLPNLRKRFEHRPAPGVLCITS